ncbi:MAG: 4-hydroxythreonine-4-phosphate dehydrogenase PdxA [Bacteroidales bacterium]|nr:4-hydroxythreonine-4-phosphate dehydrogenase PdxA [Bacteroidales bacterium]
MDVGNATEIAGKYALLALDQAIEDAKKGLIDILITAPLNKKTCQIYSKEFSGHTGYLAQKFSVLDHLMIMVSEHMKVGLVTEHVPISEVSSHITIDRILSKINLLYQSLLYDFGIINPNIAVLSLNPHAGDGGVIGQEEKEIIIPAIQSAFVSSKLNVFGPYPADGFFGSYRHKQFDGLLAMYHDQALIPFKLLGWEEGVNYTMGLPIVRTSPAHGVAYDIAGQNKASERSLTKAILLGIEIFQRRLNASELS